ncbi:hypothetical protein MSAN_01857200 [Mycena sanguinolenta]|uniref:Uncharacterized protein n=1 Tax=Mycena sanguinolenta TaxID=230812 RepID=A0A8H6XRR5_9AGAR|nr:hypothetical protein MSAN_01857200 [Mycena sanguinolenta]
MFDGALMALRLITHWSFVYSCYFLITFFPPSLRALPYPSAASPSLLFSYIHYLRLSSSHCAIRISFPTPYVPPSATLSAPRLPIYWLQKIARRSLRCFSLPPSPLPFLRGILAPEDSLQVQALGFHGAPLFRRRRYRSRGYIGSGKLPAGAGSSHFWGFAAEMCFIFLPNLQVSKLLCSPTIVVAAPGVYFLPETLRRVSTLPPSSTIAVVILSSIFAVENRQPDVSLPHLCAGAVVSGRRGAVCVSPAASSRCTKG